MRAVGYVRVSSDEQVASGAGLDGQRDAIAGHCQREGWELGSVFSDEGLSGALPLHKREGLLDAVNAVERGGMLVVARRDRLSRDVLVSAGVEQILRRRKARVVSVAGEGTADDDPTRILLRRVVDAMAEHERLVIGARTRAALQAKKKRGLRVGTVPFGFRVSGGAVSKSGKPARLVAVAREAEVVERILEWRQGGLSMRRIADRLTAEGVPTKRKGQRWSHATVQRILQRGEP